MVASVKRGRVRVFIGICAYSLINLFYAQPKLETLRLGSLLQNVIKTSPLLEHLGRHLQNR